MPAGAGAAIAAGAGGVQLQNANGVILQLSGARVGAEVSAAVGGVTITIRTSSGRLEQPSAE